jgi:hypothetical protein
MRVFFDASVIIAALLSPNGGSALLLQFIKAGVIVGITSQTVVAEILQEGKPEKLKKPHGEIQEFIARSGLVVREAVTLEEIEPYQELIDRVRRASLPGRYEDHRRDGAVARLGLRSAAVQSGHHRRKAAAPVTIVTSVVSNFG